MKNINFLKAALFVVVFASFTVTTFSVPLKTKTPSKQKTAQEATFDMWLSNTNVDLVVNYLNPESATLLVKVYDIFGNLLETSTVNSPSGKANFNLDALEAKGGTGTYNVTMSYTTGNSPKKGTIIIVRY